MTNDEQRIDAPARRQALKQLGSLALSPATLPLVGSMLAMQDAAAQAAPSDYKALVCVFLSGGNDAFNTVLATDASSWNNYAATRTSIALRAPAVAPDLSKVVGSPDWLGGVLPLSPLAPPAGRAFALHPRLTDLQRLFTTDRRLAVLANVGPLIQPLTKTQYQAAIASQIPRKLFSHNDQQYAWQSLGVEGNTVGWGGRLVDQFTLSNYAAMSPAGNAVWLAGKAVRQYQLTKDGPVMLDALANNYPLFGSLSVTQALRRIAGNTGASHVMAADLAATVDRSLTASAALTAALAQKPIAKGSALDLDMANKGPNAYVNIFGQANDNSLAQQLQVVARTIAAAGSLGVKRQVFYVNLGGFDTHDNQNSFHAELMNKLNHALNYFDIALGTLGVNKASVTTFTASDFGRSFTSNGDGTDHGWGAHHLIMGGAVKGGDIYGTFPTLGLKGAKNNQFDSPDQLGNGVLLPTTSVDQYGATLGRWFGVSESTLKDIFPNLKNFSSSNLGFMTT